MIRSANKRVTPCVYANDGPSPIASHSGHFFPPTFVSEDLISNPHVLNGCKTVSGHYSLPFGNADEEVATTTGQCATDANVSDAAAVDGFEAVGGFGVLAELEIREDGLKGGIADHHLRPPTDVVGEVLTVRSNDDFVGRMSAEVPEWRATRDYLTFGVPRWGFNDESSVRTASLLNLRFDGFDSSTDFIDVPTRNELRSETRDEMLELALREPAFDEFSFDALSFSVKVFIVGVHTLDYSASSSSSGSLKINCSL